MRRTPRPVKGDRRGVASVEFAYAMPIVFLLMFGLADVVKVARANLRAQSAALQIGVGELVAMGPCPSPLPIADGQPAD